MGRDRDGECERLRDELSVAHRVNDELENRVATLENKLRIAESEGRAAQLQVEAHAAIERVPLPTETHPTFTPKGRPKAPSIYILGIPLAFELATGIPKGVMLSRFVNGPLKATVDKHYPKMRKSAARSILLDEVCGKSVTEIPIWAKQRTSLFLDMLDTFETMIVDKQQQEANGR